MGIGGKALEMIYKHAAKEMNMIKVYGEVYEMNSRCKKNILNSFHTLLHIDKVRIIV